MPLNGLNYSPPVDDFTTYSLFLSSVFSSFYSFFPHSPLSSLLLYAFWSLNLNDMVMVHCSEHTALNNQPLTAFTGACRSSTGCQNKFDVCQQNGRYGTLFSLSTNMLSWSKHKHTKDVRRDVETQNLLNGGSQRQTIKLLPERSQWVSGRWPGPRDS